MSCSSSRAMADGIVVWYSWPKSSRPWTRRSWASTSGSISALSSPRGNRAPTPRPISRRSANGPSRGWGSHPISPPLLIGYSSGATLAYATLAQARPGTFGGGVSLGFCASLATRRTLCRGHGLITTVQSRSRTQGVAPTASLEAPWIVLQGAVDASYPPDRAEAFVRRVRGAGIVLLPKVGHGFGVESRWMPQLRQTFLRLTRPSESAASPRTPDVRDLPLIELRSSGGCRGAGCRGVG